MPTEFIDLVTINKQGDIAVVELKFDFDKLEVVSQLMNYAIFFYSYKDKLVPLLDSKLKCNSLNKRVVVYIVSNMYHHRFDTVWKYYSQGPIAMKKITMGFTEE